MIDLEITKLCAEAMGIPAELAVCNGWKELGKFDPLHDDAQNMQLAWWLADRGVLTISQDRVKYEPEGIHPKHEGNRVAWVFVARRTPEQRRRAICECVARLQEGKSHTVREDG